MRRFVRRPGGLVWLSWLVMLMPCERAGPDDTVRTSRIPLRVGDTTVFVVVHEAEAPGLTYLNLHDNEDTAVEAALAVVRRHGGRVIELRHTGDRNVAFTVQDTTYRFDPNRMFTDAGIVATLGTLSTYSRAAHEAIRSFAHSLLAVYGVGSGAREVVVAIHNNTPDNYSLQSYLRGQEYEAEARLVHRAKGADADDFFFVTDARLYEALREGGFSVVLQDNARVTDDGSLSVYMGKRGVLYVNAEAEHGHLDRQTEMLAFLHNLLQGAS